MLHETLDKQDDFTFLRLRIDEQGRMFIREEIRELLAMFPKSDVFIERTSLGLLKLKIQRRGQIVKSWLLVDERNFAETGKVPSSY